MSLARLFPVVATLLAVVACRQAPPPTFSAGAQPSIVEGLRQDLATKRHPSDGGGRAWLEPLPDFPLEATAGRPGRWVVVYEAGPLGIAEGGLLFLQVSPFWGWSTPQTRHADAPGFTEVSTTAEGVTLDAAGVDRQLLAVQVGGRGLKAGEQVRIVYGAGPAGARADRYAERRSRFWIGVDGDGDGVRGLIADSPAVNVLPGPPARLVLHLPTVAHPGETVGLTLAVLDATGNAGVKYDGVVKLVAEGGGLQLPATIRLQSTTGARTRIDVKVTGEDVQRVRATTKDGLQGVSNPLFVTSELPRVLWGDLHGHSNLSDGTGTPGDYFDYARDVAGLDVVALTDHDHWGMQPLSHHPALWEEIRRETARHHDPGHFVTLLGYEWTSWLHGHRHVLYFGDEGPVLSSVDPAFESPLQLWDALRGLPALTFAHHSAGGPIATNWDIAPDPELEPVTEITSVHGSSEAADSPKLIYSAVQGNYVRDALDRGYQLGFIGSGDSHDGHPGLAHLAAASGGLAAILSDTSTREGVLAAFRARRVYATNGPRILLAARLAGHLMGSAVPAGEAELDVFVVSPQPLARMLLVRSGEVVETVPGEDRTRLTWRRLFKGLESGEYVYVRVEQEDGGAAWSSPFFVE